MTKEKVRTQFPKQYDENNSTDILVQDNLDDRPIVIKTLEMLQSKRKLMDITSLTKNSKSLSSQSYGNSNNNNRKPFCNRFVIVTIIVVLLLTH